MLKIYNRRCLGKTITLGLPRWDGGSGLLYVTFKKRRDNGLAELWTSDEVVQFNVEHSDEYSKGVITLAYEEATVEVDDKDKDGNGSNGGAATEEEENLDDMILFTINEPPRVYDKVDTFKEARSILNTKYEVAYNRMRNAEAVFQMAREMNVLFPLLEEKENSKR